jgi:hypothetical protein
MLASPRRDLHMHRMPIRGLIQQREQAQCDHRYPFPDNSGEPALGMA